MIRTVSEDSVFSDMRSDDSLWDHSVFSDATHTSESEPEVVAKPYVSKYKRLERNSIRKANNMQAELRSRTKNRSPEVVIAVLKGT